MAFEIKVLANEVVRGEVLKDGIIRVPESWVGRDVLIIYESYLSNRR